MDKIDYEIFDEQIDRFLRHQMNAEEETKFKAHLANNEELRQRAHSIAITIKEMRAIQKQQDTALVETIMEISEKDFRKVARITAKKIHLVPLFTKLAIAVCFVGFAFFISTRYMLYKNTIELGNNSYSAYVSDMSEYGVSRGVANANIIRQLEEHFLNVKNGKDLDATISTLEGIYDKAQDEDSILSEFIDDIAWNLSIAYLKTGERDKTLPLLEEILKRNEGYPDIEKHVKKLIYDIKKLRKKCYICMES